MREREILAPLKSKLTTVEHSDNAQVTSVWSQSSARCSSSALIDEKYAWQSVHSNIECRWSRCVFKVDALVGSSIVGSDRATYEVVTVRSIPETSVASSGKCVQLFLHSVVSECLPIRVEMLIVRRKNGDRINLLSNLLFVTEWTRERLAKENTGEDFCEA